MRVAHVVRPIVKLLAEVALAQGSRWADLPQQEEDEYDTARFIGYIQRKPEFVQIEAQQLQRGLQSTDMVVIRAVIARNQLTYVGLLTMIDDSVKAAGITKLEVQKTPLPAKQLWRSDVEQPGELEHIVSILNELK